jgi:16S rRNA G966 N2-methylase RsmD
LPAKLGRDGKRRRLPVIPTETKAQADRAARALRSIPDPPSRPMKLAVAERLARNERLRAATDSKGVPGGVEVFCSDFRQLDLPDASADLIFPDPPWYEPDLYGDLAHFAARVLKPGRLCCVYISAAALPEVIARMGEGLDYYRCLAVGYQNAHCHRNAIVDFTVTWAPVLAFSKGRVESRPKHAPLDFLSTSCGRTDKTSHHHWQQEGEPARYWLERLTLPGDVILDPFAGSGQFVVEAFRVGGRRVIACDIDPEAAETTRRRLARAGLDCLLAARRVGPTGKLVGVRLWPEMVEKARRNAWLLGLHSAEFVNTGIEKLPLPDGWVKEGSLTKLRYVFVSDRVP